MLKPPAPDPAALTWRCCAFGELSVYELQAIYALRQLVFIIEQQCLYLDADAFDCDSLHLAAWAHPAPRSGQPVPDLPVAYARLVPPALKYHDPSIGRVVTASAVRGTGLGRVLVCRAIVETQRAFPGQPIRISAQSRLQAFYAGLGFAVIGEQYLEDGIPHTEMLLASAG